MLRKIDNEKEKNIMRGNLRLFFMNFRHQSFYVIAKMGKFFDWGSICPIYNEIQGLKFF